MTHRTAHAPHHRSVRRGQARVALARLLARWRQQDAALHGLLDDERLTPAELEDAIRALDAATPGCALRPGAGPSPDGGRR